MNTQTTQPLYSWIRGVDLTQSQRQMVEVQLPDDTENTRNLSFAFTPEGRYLQTYKDSAVES